MVKFGEIYSIDFSSNPTSKKSDWTRTAVPVRHTEEQNVQVERGKLNKFAKKKLAAGKKFQI